MTTLLALLAFPLIWPWIAKTIWKTELTWTEVAINIVGVMLIVLLVYGAGSFSQVADREVWNGQITGKAKTRVSCEHSYSCNCRESCSGSGNSRSCSTICDTCYEHSYDIDWRVHTSIDEFNIHRIDRQGLSTPPRWLTVAQGQPYATTRHFTNYIKGAPNSILHIDHILIAKYTNSVPAYPLAGYDYQYIDRVIPVGGVVVPDLAKWNYDLAMTLRDLGPQKQANVIIMFVKDIDPNYAFAVENAWLGGKKNDIIILIGTPEYPKIEWVRVLSWTKKELYKVQLRDNILELGTVDKDKILGIIHNDTLKSFERRHMKDFEYLRTEIEPPDWVIILAGLLAVLGSVGVSIWLSRRGVDIDLFSGSTSRYGRYR
jgi:hypothetical protein